MGFVPLVKKWPSPHCKMFYDTNLPCLFVCFVAFCLLKRLFPFAIYNWYIICAGRTTNEDVRGKYKLWKKNPFHEGFITNFTKVWTYYKSRVLDLGPGDNDDVITWDLKLRDENLEAHANVDNPHLNRRDPDIDFEIDYQGR